MDQPADIPVRNRPTNIRAKKGNTEEARIESEMRSHPMRAGTPPIMRAAWRPRYSVAGHARIPPNIPPMGTRPYKQTQSTSFRYLIN